MRDLRPILLVEDSPKDAELTMAALARCQLLNDVIHVRDGAEALDYLRCEGKFAGAMHGGPVVVLLDLKLPKVNGLEVLEQVRGDPQLSSTPVVMLTSSREEQDLVQLRTGRECLRGQAGRLQGILRRHPGAGHVLGHHQPATTASAQRFGAAQCMMDRAAASACASSCWRTARLMRS